MFKEATMGSALSSPVARSLALVILVKFATANQYSTQSLVSQKNVNSSRSFGNIRPENLFTPKPKTVRPFKPRPQVPPNKLAIQVVTTTTGSLPNPTTNDVITEPPVLGIMPEQEDSNSTSGQKETGEEELLCLLKLYTDIVVEQKVTQIGHIDVDNNRLIFLIPLIIIYWHHRHPHDILPFSDLEVLLQELGDEARVHRRVLNKMVLRIDQCYASLATGDPFEDQPGVIMATRRRQEEQLRAAQALKVIDSWLSDGHSIRLASSTQDRTGLATNQTNPLMADLYSSLSLRRSSAREIRHWFESFLSLNSTNSRSKHKDKTGTTTLKPTQVETTTALHEENNQTKSSAAGEVAELNKDVQSTRSEFPLGNTNAPDNLSTHKQEPNIDSNVTGQIENRTQTQNLYDGRLSELSLLNASQNNEFFDLVASILMEMDTINNSTVMSL